MTRDEFVCSMIRKAGITPADAARLAEAVFEADGRRAVLEAFRELESPVDRSPGKGGHGKPGRRRRAGLSEAQIRAKLIDGFMKARGIEIEDVFPGGWSESVRP